MSTIKTGINEKIYRTNIKNIIFNNQITINLSVLWISILYNNINLFKMLIKLDDLCLDDIDNINLLIWCVGNNKYYAKKLLKYGYNLNHFYDYLNNISIYSKMLLKLILNICDICDINIIIDIFTKNNNHKMVKKLNKHFN